MRRGAVVSVAIQGDFGKPRPALVVQADPFLEHSSVTVLPLTTTLKHAPLMRVSVQPTESNGLRQPSQIMVDKIVTVRVDRIGSVLGQIAADTLVEVERCLAVFLGIAK